MKRPIIILVCICVSLFANAQSDSLKPLLNMSLEELMNMKVITAGKREQKISDIPASVVVVTRAEIEAYGYQSLKEILSNMLGMYKIDDYKNVSFGIRGFFSNVYSRNIIFMINGLIQQQPYLNWNDLNLMNLQVESIERIEFVRGPVAIIYGNDAFFGAINIITHKNGDNIKSSATISYGNNNTYRANIQINSATEKTTVNLSGGYYHTDGVDIPFHKILDSVQRYDKTWVKNGTTKDYFKQNSSYINLSINHKSFYATVSYDLTYRNLIHFWKPVYDTIKNTKRDFILRNSIGYRKEINPRFLFDIHAEIQNSYYTNGYLKAFAPTDIKYGYAKSESQKTIIELITFIKPIEKINITLGINYSVIPRGYLDLDVPALGYDRYSVNLNSPSMLYAAFSQVEYAITKKIHILAGVRADKQNQYDYKNIKFVSNIYKDTIYTYTYNKTIMVPRTTIIYAINPKNILKLMYGKASSRPGIYENSYVNWELHPLLVPQTISTTELNYSCTLFNNLTFNLSGFHNKLDKLINRHSVTDTKTGKYKNVNNNTEKLETLGGEFQIVYKPIENLLFDVSFSYQKTKNTLFDNNAAYSPNLLAYFKVIYTIRKNIIFGVSSYYVGAMESGWDDAPTDPLNGNLAHIGRISKTTPAYFNLSANLRFKNIFKKGLYFSLHADNLLNADIYYAPTFVNSSYLPNGTYDTGIKMNAILGLKF